MPNWYFSLNNMIKSLGLSWGKKGMVTLKFEMLIKFGVSMNDDYYRKANIINASVIYRSKIRFMTLKQIKELHDGNGICSKDLRLDQDTMLSTIKLLERNLV